MNTKNRGIESTKRALSVMGTGNSHPVLIPSTKPRGVKRDVIKPQRTIAALVGLVFLLHMSHVFVEGASLIKDINPTPTGSSPSRAISVGGTAFFAADDGIHGAELWKTDGTAGNATMVKDVFTGEGSSSPSDLVEMNGFLYFVAYGSPSGRELWRSDGTDSGTTVVARNQFSYPSGLVVMDGVLYFSASPYNSFSDRELWRSDGTSAGTWLVRDINTGTYDGSDPTFLTPVGGALFFVATNGTDGLELWRSDGTNAGTTEVRIINPGNSDYSDGPEELVNSNGVLFFTANDGTNGRELWRSDGTPAGTLLVANLDPDTTDYSGPGNLVSVGSKVFFVLDYSEGLWASDGTALGTVKVSDSYSASNLTAMNSMLYFNSYGGLWRSDGTPSGTSLVSTVYPANMCAVGGTLFFAGSDSSSGYELWKSDGTAEGTALVKDISPGESSSSPTNQSDFNGACLFSATEAAYGLELWISNGLPEGTFNVKDINSLGTLGSALTDLVGYDDNLYFYVFEAVPALWKSDGSSGGTNQLMEMPGIEAGALADYGGFLFFSERNILYRSDGTRLGTFKFFEETGSDLTGIHRCLPLRTVSDSQEMLYFAVDDRLYKTTVNGSPQRLKNSASGMFIGQIKHMTSVYPNASPQDARLFFTCHTGGFFSDYQLFVSDGTPGGTTSISDIGFSVDSDPQNLTNVNGVCFFHADDGGTFSSDHGRELWKSDGSYSGTVLVKDITPGNDSTEFGDFASLNGLLYFAANNQLWSSDGTQEGTTAVVNLDPIGLVALDDKLILSADDGISGAEIWVSDGSPAGTAILKDIVGGPEGSNPSNLTRIGDKIYFAANGNEIWETDGSAQGTVKLGEAGSPGIASPDLFCLVGSRLFLAASDVAHGRELWGQVLNGLPKPPASVRGSWLLYE